MVGRAGRPSRLRPSAGGVSPGSAQPGSSAPVPTPARGDSAASAAPEGQDKTRPAAPLGAAAPGEPPSGGGGGGPSPTAPASPDRRVSGLVRSRERGRLPPEWGLLLPPAAAGSKGWGLGLTAAARGAPRSAPLSKGNPPSKGDLGDLSVLGEALRGGGALPL